jgi:hypothetical protein
MFIGFTAMKAAAIKNMWRYPTSTNCDNIENIFKNNTYSSPYDNPNYEFYAVTVDKSLTEAR